MSGSLLFGCGDRRQGILLVIVKLRRGGIRYGDSKMASLG